MASRKEFETIIKLGGKVDPSLTASLGKAGKDTEKLADKVDKSQSRMSGAVKAAGLAVVAGVTAGVMGLGAMSMKAVESADELLKLKDKTQISVEELQRLQYMSNQLGADFGGIQKATTVLTKNMDAARRGSKDTAAAFKTLGIEVIDANTKALRPQSEVLNEALVELSAMENQSERNALAFKLFGKGAADLFPILNAGPEGIRDFAQEADKLGLVMSEDAVNGLDEFGDTMDKLKLTVQGLGNKVAAEVIPKVTPLLDKFTTFVSTTDVSGYIDSATGFISAMGSTVGFLSDNMNILLPVLIGVSTAIGAYTIISTVKGMMDAWKASTFAMTLAQEGLNVALKSNPIGLVATVIGLLIAAGVALYMNWDTVTKGIGALWENNVMPFFNSVGGFFSKIFDLAFGGIKSKINMIFGIGNIIIDFLNGIDYTIPDWVPGLGGKRIGFDIKHLPMFAKGGFTNQPSIAGEDGTEAIIPIKEGNKRSIQLLLQTADLLGLGQMFKPKTQVVNNLVPVPSGGSSNSKSLSGGSYDININIKVDSESNASEGLKGSIKSAVMEVIEEIFDDKERVAFG